MSPYQQSGGPPPPPSYPPGPYGTYAPLGPRPWSAAAIAAFVLSLLGFLGVTAILGIIFGIVGMIVTGGGRRRGMGLAIAAIPISIVTGTLAVLIALSVTMMVRGAKLVEALEPVLSASSPAIPLAAQSLHALGSTDFQASVSEARLEEWLRRISTTNGRITSFRPDPTMPFAKSPDGKLVLCFEGKFINGPASIRLTFSDKDIWRLKISDIEIGGSSPRDGGPPNP